MVLSALLLRQYASCGLQRKRLEIAVFVRDAGPDSGRQPLLTVERRKGNQKNSPSLATATCCIFAYRKSAAGRTSRRIIGGQVERRLIGVRSQNSANAPDIHGGEARGRFHHGRWLVLIANRCLNSRFGVGGPVHGV
jgi:hypothetical protein